MRHLSKLEQLSLETSYITIGSFDGVHIGHQRIIKSMVKAARQDHLPSVVVTFHPHPAVVLRHIEEPYYLTTPNERASILLDLGVDYIVTLHFDEAFSLLSPFEFMQMIQRHIHPRRLYIGEDFHLGRDRVGDSAALTKLGQQMGYQLEIIQQVDEEGQRVSSSQVRKHLMNGEVALAAHLLGRWYSISDLVVENTYTENDSTFVRRALSFPPQKLLPIPGVYAALIQFKSVLLKSVAYIRSPSIRDQIGPGISLDVFHSKSSEKTPAHEIKLHFVQSIRHGNVSIDDEEFPSLLKSDMTSSQEVLSNVLAEKSLSPGSQNTFP
jgi:riboflavin kinase/FMN adenylyltransferase